jgi:cell division protein FtsL
MSLFKKNNEDNINNAFQTLIIIVMIMSIFITYVWQRVMIVEIGYNIEGLRKEKAELSRRNAELLTEVASLSSLKRIEKIAADIGMKRPEKGSVIAVREIRLPQVMIGEAERDYKLTKSELKGLNKPRS